MNNNLRAVMLVSVVASSLWACGDDNDDLLQEPLAALDAGEPDVGSTAPDTGSTTTPDAGSTAPEVDAGVANSQQPPQGQAAIDAWLASGAYLSWNCEPEALQRTSIHGPDRICSNDIIADDLQASNTAAWRQGAAAVKELYNSDLSSIIGYAVYLKTAPDSANGDNWYWYEVIDGAIFADGLGESQCSGCHSAANDEQVGARDFVYAPIGRQDAGEDRSQIPPQGASAIDAWLAGGAYLNWSCEPQALQRSSIHGPDRVCSNDIIVEDLRASSTAPWRQGAAAVKELYNEDLSSIIGYAVYLKTDADSANGSNWYWYEVINDSIFADGLGESQCFGCHSAANNPQEGARDFVYLPIGSAN